MVTDHVTVLKPFNRRKVKGFGFIVLDMGRQSIGSTSRSVDMDGSIIASSAGNNELSNLKEISEYVGEAGRGCIRVC